jgi:hypothetical protein
MGPPSCMRSVVDRNVFMRSIPVYGCCIYFVIGSRTYLLPILACSHLTQNWCVIQNRFSSAAEDEISKACMKSNCFRPSEPVMLLTLNHVLSYRGTSAAGIMQGEFLLARDVPKFVSRTNCVEGEILRGSVPRGN